MGHLHHATWQALRDDAELRRKQEIHEAEESKNAHIQDLMKKHEKVDPERFLAVKYILTIVISYSNSPRSVWRSSNICIRIAQLLCA